MEKEIITALLLGIGLSASVGFRVFVPMLVASVAARMGLLPVNESFEWLTSGAAIACFSAATVVEIVAYYIPFVDNLLDTISSPLAVGAGTLLMGTVLPVDNELMKWVVALIVGGGTASVVQGATTVSRLSSSTLTAGLGNPVVASGENLAAVSLPIFSIALPILVGVVVLLTLIFLLRKIFKRRKARVQ